MSARARPWQIAAAIAALRTAFPPPARVHVGRESLFGDGLKLIVVPPPVEDPRDFRRWQPLDLWIAAPLLAACPDEAAVAQLIRDAVPKMRQGREGTSLRHRGTRGEELGR